MEVRSQVPNVPALDWISGQVHLELAHQGRVRSFRFQGPFARIGEHERCEIRVPGIGAPVVAYVQVGAGYLAVMDLSETFPVSRCEVQYVLPGGSVWLQPNVRLTLESIQHDAPTSDAFSWESFELEDLCVLPNTLVLETGGTKPESKENLFRLTTVLSVLGTDPACQLQLKHHTIERFHCVLFRGEHLGKPVRVVDLLASSPAMVDGKNANGAVLDVGARLHCGKMILSARRVLTDALIPTKANSRTVPGLQSDPPISGVTPVPQLVKPTNPNEPDIPDDIAVVVGDQNPSNVMKDSVCNETTVPRLSTAMSELEQAFGIVLEKIVTLELVYQQVAEGTRRDIGEVDPKNGASVVSLQKSNATQLASLRMTINALMKSYAMASPSARNHGPNELDLGMLAKPTSPIPVPEMVSKNAVEAQIVESRSRHAGEPLGVPVPFGKNLDPDSPQLLASSDSPEETFVLGSLMELRQRKASARAMQIGILTAVFIAVVGIAVPVVWYQIPEGWRELIWRMGTKQSEAVPDRASTDPKPLNR